MHTDVLISGIYICIIFSISTDYMTMLTTPGKL